MGLKRFFPSPEIRLETGGCSKESAGRIIHQVNRTLNCLQTENRADPPPLSHPQSGQCPCTKTALPLGPSCRLVQMHGQALWCKSISMLFLTASDWPEKHTMPCRGKHAGPCRHTPGRLVEFRLFPPGAFGGCGRYGTGQVAHRLCGYNGWPDWQARSIYAGDCWLGTSMAFCAMLLLQPPSGPFRPGKPQPAWHATGRWTCPAGLIGLQNLQLPCRMYPAGGTVPPRERETYPIFCPPILTTLPRCNAVLNMRI